MTQFRPQCATSHRAAAIVAVVGALAATSLLLLPALSVPAGHRNRHGPGCHRSRTTGLPLTSDRS